MAVERRVCRLRLRGTDEAALRRAGTLLEDALRTASLRDEGGRILLVRRMALGRLGARARPDQVAGTVERALQAAAAECRHGTEPTAGRATMVWFADALEGHLALARRLLIGPPPREWYWPLVARAWRPDAGVGAGLAALASSLAALREAPSALPAWLAALTREGHADALRAALTDDHVRALTEVLEASPGAGADAVLPDGAGSTATMVPRLARPWDEPRPAAPPVAERSPTPNAFLAGALRAAGEEAVPGGHHHGSTSRSAAGGPSRPAGLGRGEAPTSRAERLGPGALRSGRATTAPGVSRACGPHLEPPPTPSDATPRDRRARRVGGGPAPHASATTVEPEPAQAPPVAPAWPALSDTAAGGIAFVLNILARLRFAAWLERHPGYATRDPARRVLARILDGLELPGEDPVRALIRPVPQGPREAREAVIARAWSVAAHGWLRRHVGVSMAELVLRPARLAATRTHIDLWFDPAQCDVRIRRAGLDLDPGWLAWLGRVVAFHYQPLGAR